MDTHSRFYRLSRKDIAYFKFVVESYEGMAVVRTRDPRQAMIELQVAPGWEEEAEKLVEALRSEILIEPL
jgi:hypothetical protein